MKHKLSSTFSRLLISFTIVSLIPILVIFLYVYPKLNSTIKTKILTESSLALENSQIEIDKHLREIYQLIVAISNNPKLSSNYLKSSMYHRVEGIDEVSKFLSMNKFVDNAHIYIKDMNMVLNKDGVIPYQDFLAKFNDWENMRHLLFDINPRVYIHNNTPYNLTDTITYNVIPMIISIDNGNITLTVTIRGDAFTNIFESIYHNPDYGMLMYGTNNNVLLSNQDINKELLKDLQKASGNNPSTFILKSQGKKYVLSTTKSQVMDIIYVSFLPYNSVIQDIHNLQIQSLQLVIIILILGGIIAYLLSKINYRPIKGIIDLLNDTNADCQNEYQVIQQNIIKLVDQNESVNKQLKKSLPASKEYLMKMLINKQITTLDQFNEIGSNIGIFIEGDIFNVTCIKIKPNNPNHNIPLRDVNNLKELMNEYVTGEISLGLQKHTLLLITGSKRTNGLKYFLNDVYRFFSSYDDCNIYIGISNNYRDFESINTAYNEALSVIAYQVLHHKTGLFHFDDLPDLDENDIYPTKLINKFRNNIIQRNIEESNKAYDNLIFILKNPRNHIVFIKNLVHDMYKILLHINKDLNGVLLEDNIFLNRIFQNDYSLDYMLNHIKALYQQILERIKIKKSELLITEILLYINNHFNEDDMSLQKVAKEFDMSTSNLSHYFKKYTKINFLAYVRYLRIDESKRLLKTTNEPISEISKQVGFFALNSFNRTFKKEVGMSPRQYRLDNLDN